ncbi:MAG: nucleotide exchange factor GrpE [Candidatus Moranbacteria bacterium]|nr:nucleotide exchange factor GrpE [Candidatus Moranbacteria bacterium]
MTEKQEEKKSPETGRQSSKFYLSQKGIIYDPAQKKYLVLTLSRDREWFINKYGAGDAPGGRLEIDEDIKDSLMREIKEEVGDIEVEIRDCLGVSSVEYKSGEAMILWYLIYYRNGEIKLSSTHDAFDWKTVKEIESNESYNKWIKEYVKKAEKSIISKSYLDSWKRCQADFENYKKSQAKHLEEFRKYAKMDVILQILPVVDNFEASLAHVPEKEKDSAWVTGITHIKRQIQDILKNNDIEEIEVKAGDKFDPEIHEAVGGDGRKQKVNKVIQKGYKLNGRILRAAKVEVG